MGRVFDAFLLYINGFFCPSVPHRAAVSTGLSDTGAQGTQAEEFAPIRNSKTNKYYNPSNIFVVSEEDINLLVEKAIPENTKKSTSYAVNVFDGELLVNVSFNCQHK